MLRLCHRCLRLLDPDPDELVCPNCHEYTMPPVPQNIIDSARSELKSIVACSDTP